MKVFQDFIFLTMYPAVMLYAPIQAFAKVLLSSHTSFFISIVLRLMDASTIELNAPINDRAEEITMIQSLCK